MWTVINALYQSWDIGNSGLSLSEQLAYIVIMFVVFAGLGISLRRDNNLCHK